MAETRGLDFIGVQMINGRPAGPTFQGDAFFINSRFGVVFLDRSNGNYYRLFFDQGSLQTEQITLEAQ